MKDPDSYSQKGARLTTARDSRQTLTMTTYNREVEMADCILAETLSGLPVYLLQPLISSLGSFQENSLGCIHAGDSAFIKVLVAIKKSKFSPVQFLQ